MAALEPDLIYVLDRGYIHFELLGRILHACSDFVVRLKKNNLFVPIKSQTPGDEDLAAGVISDRIGRLSGSGESHAPGAMLREIMIFDPNNPDKPVRLLTSILDVPAHVVGELYRWRFVRARVKMVRYSRDGARSRRGEYDPGNGSAGDCVWLKGL